MNKIPFHIISGFLGSGKTTFLKRIIETWSFKFKLGVVQNEFAPSNIDGFGLKNSGDNFHLLEINSGSAFCDCLMGPFARSLEKFIETSNPDILLMEASGLSDTSSIAEVVSAGKLSGKIFLASNWCIIDALNFNKGGLMKQRMHQQIRMADKLIVNKTDMVEGGTGQLLAELKMLNPFAEIHLTSWCRLDFEWLNQPVPKFYPGMEPPLARPEINSMVIKSGRKMTVEQLNGFLAEWAPEANRIKGYVNLKNGKVMAVQCVFGKIDLAETSGNFHTTELVALTHRFTLPDWNKSFRKFAG